MNGTRRDFLRGFGAVSTAGLFGLRADPVAAEPPLETTKLRIFEGPIICIAPQFIAQELLYAEGFTDVKYVKYPSETRSWVPEVLVSGEVDFSLSFVPTDLVHMDGGAPFVLLAGSHIGCVELFGSSRIRSIRELKGKTVAVSRLGSDGHIFTAMFVAHVGIDPQKDINWVIYPSLAEQMRLLAEQKIDAFFAGPPFSLEMRAKKIGRVLVNTTTDKPWSQYFCCMVAGNKEYVRKYPVATKRALRAILKATDVCGLEPARVARLITDRGLAPSYDVALQSMKELPYGNWREYDAESSVRFYALWLRDVGMITSSPQKILAEGTDWRFLNELKRELKG